MYEHARHTQISFLCTKYIALVLNRLEENLYSHSVSTFHGKMLAIIWSLSQEHFFVE